MEARSVTIEPHNPMTREERRVDAIDGESIVDVTGLAGARWPMEDEHDAIDEGGSDELSLESNDPLVILHESIRVLESDITDIRTVLQVMADCLERSGLWGARETAELNRLRTGSA